jgi:hypothetical protein
MAPDAEWTLSSTSGRVRMMAWRNISGGAGDVWYLHLEYRLPDDAEPAFVEVPYLRIDRKGLIAFVAALRPWLAQPLGAIGNDTLSYSIDLAAEASNRLLIELGTREDVVTSVGGVGCLIEMVYNSLKTSVAFATDPTCLEALTSDLEGVLSDAAG